MLDRKQPAVFLDRDGTMIEEVGFITSENDIDIFPFTADALRILRKLGYLLIVVSNQSGVARGYLTEERVVELNDEIFRRLKDQGARPDFFFYCPHHPDATVDMYRVDCNCRKPKTGMIDAALKEVDIDLSRSFSVGDKLSDVRLGQNIGGRGILVLTGYGQLEEAKIQPTSIVPDKIVLTLLDAAQWIKESGRNF
jgi:D-glycero-D-manno-heptose 1,7-bisphosphate phosphatase